METMVDALSSFFGSIVASIDSLIDILGGQLGIYPFLVYVYELCIPNEINYLAMLFVMMLIVLGFIRHTKG